MALQIKNNAFGTLGSGITNVATTIALTAGHGLRFPIAGGGNIFFATLIDSSGNLEIIKVTNLSVDTLTVARAQDGTTGRAYSAGDRIEVRPTAITLFTLQQEAIAAATATGTDTYVATLTPTPLQYNTDQVYCARILNTNTLTTPTLNFNALGAITIKRPGGGACVAGDLNGTHFFHYDGTNFIVLNPRWVNGTTMTGPLTLTGTLTGVAANFSGAASVSLATASYGLLITNSAAAGSSFGLAVNAGGSAADQSLLVRDRTGSSVYLGVRGDGAVTMAGTLGVTGIVTLGNIITPTADNTSGLGSGALRFADLRTVLATVSGLATFAGARILINGGAIPRVDFAPSSGNTRTGSLTQQGDSLIFASDLANLTSINLSTGAVNVTQNLTVAGAATVGTAGGGNTFTVNGNRVVLSSATSATAQLSLITNGTIEWDINAKTGGGAFTISTAGAVDCFQLSATGNATLTGSLGVTGTGTSNGGWWTSGASLASPGFFQSGTIAAQAGTAYGFLSRGTLSASANGDSLYAISSDNGVAATGIRTGLGFAAVVAHGLSWSKTGTGTIDNAYGLLATAPTIGTTNWAGYFQGAVGVTGQITSTVGGVTLFTSAATAASSGSYIRHGSSFFGQESGAGGSVMTGGVANAGVFGTYANVPLQIAVNNAEVARFDGAGGNFVLGRAAAAGGYGDGGTPKILETYGGAGYGLNILSTSATASAATVGGITFGTTGTAAAEKRAGIFVATLSAASGTVVSGQFDWYLNSAGSLGSRMTLQAGGTLILNQSFTSDGLIVGAGRVSDALICGNLGSGVSPLIALDYGGANKFKVDNGGSISTGTTGANANNYFIQLSAGDTGLSRFIANRTSGQQGFLDYDHSADKWSIKTAGSERVTIGSAGLVASVGITSSSPSAGIGYSTGAGGTVTQATSKSTNVTLNAACGQITMNAAALAANTTVTFILTNSAIGANDVVHVSPLSGGTLGAYVVYIQAGGGSATVTVRNVTAGSLSEALVLSFVVIKAVTS